MENIQKASDALFKEIITAEGISFRGVKIGDSLEAVKLQEGNSFEDRGGSLPNYKYFLEIGEMEELELVYCYDTTSKLVYNLELKLTTYPKYYWEQAGGKDEMDLLQEVRDNNLDQYIQHFLACKNRIIAHFEAQFGKAEIDLKHKVFKHPHQNFIKHTWLAENQRLTLMSYLDDLDTYRRPLMMKLYMILSKP